MPVLRPLLLLVQLPVLVGELHVWLAQVAVLAARLLLLLLMLHMLRR